MLDAFIFGFPSIFTGSFVCLAHTKRCQRNPMRIQSRTRNFNWCLLSLQYLFIYLIAKSDRNGMKNIAKFINSVRHSHCWYARRIDRLRAIKRQQKNRFNKSSIKWMNSFSIWNCSNFSFYFSFLCHSFMCSQWCPIGTKGHNPLTNVRRMWTDWRKKIIQRQNKQHFEYETRPDTYSQDTPSSHNTKTLIQHSHSEPIATARCSHRVLYVAHMLLFTKIHLHANVFAFIFSIHSRIFLYVYIFGIVEDTDKWSYGQTGLLCSQLWMALATLAIHHFRFSCNTRNIQAKCVEFDSPYLVVGLSWVRGGRRRIRNW